jgi:hypothetical protein
VKIQYPAALTITATGSLVYSTSTSGSDAITTFTSGTGTITFS